MEAGGQQAAAPAPAMSAPQPAKNNNKKIIIIIVAIFGGLFLLAAILFVVFIANLAGFATDVISEVTDRARENSYRMFCEYDKGSVAIYYDRDGLNGYELTGKASLDYDQERLKVARLGINAYLHDYADRFADEYSGGHCEASMFFDNDDDDDSSSSYNWGNDSGSSATTTDDVKVVGSDEYGYLEIPKNWYDFHDVEGTDSLQWSYGISYIVSLYAYGDKAEGTAKQYADSYMIAKQADSEVTGVTGATVKIGSDKKYTAYQVYMYYPSDNTYLVTYWFDDENGNVHYISLEGPEGVENYTSIPESFRLKK